MRQPTGASAGGPTSSAIHEPGCPWCVPPRGLCLRRADSRLATAEPVELLAPGADLPWQVASVDGGTLECKRHSCGRPSRDHRGWLPTEDKETGRSVTPC
ncbi:hypothetical protein ACFPM0_28525 [Pseudonocardia sulfidoxydans]|uniref:hypothetical protein n=1 Tax=Pseudonocardia sulfidoxydans TaxID=54011 RepID=UPI0036130232